MASTIVFPIPLPPPLIFYERMLNYFPDWMETDFGQEVTIYENIVYGGEIYTELSEKPVTAIHEVKMIIGEGRSPVDENHTYLTGDSRTDILLPNIHNISSLKAKKDGIYYNFIKNHDYTWDDTGIIWTVGGDKPDNGTRVDIHYISTKELHIFVNGEDYVLFNNNIYWFNPESQPVGGSTIQVTYYQLVSSKIIAAFIKAFADEFEEYIYNLKEVQEAHWIDYMEGQELDFTGALFQLERLTGETDTVYRARLKGFITNFVGGGTVQSIKNSINIITGVDPEVHDGQFTNAEKFTTTEVKLQTSVYRTTDTYIKLDFNPVVSITSISGTKGGSPYVFVNGFDYDIYSEANIRWRFKAGVEPTADIPDNLTAIDITYVAEVADFDPAKMRVDVKAADMAGTTTEVIYNALDDAKAAGVMYILNIDVELSDIVTVAEDVFTASPDIEGSYSDGQTTTETFSVAATLSIGDISDLMIWDVDNWDEDDWAPDVDEDDVVSVSESITLTIGP